MSWGRITIASVSVAAGAKVLFGTFVLSNGGIGETVLRSRGRWAMSANAAPQILQLAWGLVVVSDLALAAGAASIPGPDTDASDDGWFVWDAAEGQKAVVGEGFVFEFDSKGRRRVEEGFSIAMMVENPTAAAVDFSMSISLLSRIS